MIRQIGQYRIQRVLGGGGMGIVYRALDTAVGREVALKQLRSEFAASPEVRERFRNEAKLQGRLNHPNIAQLYSLEQTPDAFCLVMELVEGVMVKDLMPFDWKSAVALMVQVLDALGYAHSLGVLHRDIKPENILLDQRGSVKVMDFGIAYAVGSQRMTREKSIVGTIEYMSPERILNKPMDGRSDVYSLGILLFEMLSGRLPFHETNEFDILRWHIEGAGPPVTDVVAVPGFLDTVIQKALNKDPEARFATCSEMARFLQQSAGDLRAPSQMLAPLVAARMEASRGQVFDSAACYARVCEHIRRGDLAAAENALESEARRFPCEEGLRQYAGIVSQAIAESRNSAQGDRMLAWLRMIAAERCGDGALYQAELSRALSDFPDFAVAGILHAAETRAPRRTA